MSDKKKIPCRVCGKLFEPCAYCQEHADVFRWRNFACSIKCAKKYVTDAMAYRESLKNTKQDNEEKKSMIENNQVVNSFTTKKKINKKNIPDSTEETINDIN